MNNRHRGKVNDLVTMALVEGSQIPDPENEFGYATSIRGARSGRSRIGMTYSLGSQDLPPVCLRNPCSR
jgi:hypothetical protein